MAQIIIDTGAAANDGTGDPLRTAFTDTNTNFTEIYTAGPVASNVQIANNTILTINTNGNLVLAPNGVGVVQSNVNIVPNSSNIRNLGSSTQRWSTVYAQYLDVTNGSIYSGDLSVTGNLTAATVTTPELTVNMISSDDSTVVKIQDGVEVDGDMLVNGTIGATPQTKASNAVGTAGQICWDANYIYVCTATDVWKRVLLTGGY
jgi:hypothetical protein